MKIRNKITLWITGAGLLAGLLFSLVITYELIEQPYDLLDGELDSQASTLLTGLHPYNGHLDTQSNRAMLDSIGILYWFKVFNMQRKLIYASSMTKFVDLPLKEQNGGYNINAIIPREMAGLEQDDNPEVTFRIRVFTILHAGHEYLVQIARPMEKLQEEVNDLILSLTIGLSCFALALVLMGYFVAGKILQPIADINALAREISEKTLDKRIPLGRNQDELFILSSSLNQMFDRLQFSFKKQKEFIANASHELKTPIAMQRLFLGEAVQRDDLPDNFAMRLSRQSEILLRMDRLVKNLLDLSALQLKETVTLMRVDMTQLISTILSEFEEIIQTSDIHLNLELKDSIFLSGDEEKLRRMFINLIDNAIKYNNKEKGVIQVSLKKNNQDVEIIIYNTGIGIPATEQKMIFDQFYRVEKSRATASGGSGLGLTIVKRIVELHHGRIEIESEYGNWVRISILLPLRVSE
ncbi:MAG TPA: HAMP domain-containing histidine kinase [Desulfobulbus sp.]|nr:HAMP domain-containing histidine kinase [Desulfobulbus sp.]